MLFGSARAAVAISLVLIVSAVAPAHADPLVSGYGGPGSGDQNVLGSTLLPGGGKGKGNGGGGGSGAGDGDAKGSGLRAARTQATPVLTPAPSSEPVAPGATQVGGGSAARSSGQGGTASKQSGERARTKQRGESAASAPATPPAIAPVENTGATTSAGSLPIAGSDLLIILAVLAGLGLAGFASARLARSEQASA